jgi:hypothetical protein
MYHAVPYAQQFQQMHPNTNVTLIEWLDIVEESFSDPAKLLKDSRPKPGVIFGRWLSVARDPGLEKRIGGRRACLLNGTDKPCIIQDQTRAQAFFPEGLMRLNSYCTKSGNLFTGHQTCQTWPFEDGTNCWISVVETLWLIVLIVTTKLWKLVQQQK